MIARCLAALLAAIVLMRPACAVTIEDRFDPRGLDTAIELPGEEFRPSELFVYAIDPVPHAYTLNVAVGLFGLLFDRRVEGFRVELSGAPGLGAPDALDLTPVLGEDEGLTILERSIVVAPTTPLFLSVGWEALSFAGYRIELASDLPAAPVPLPAPATLLVGAFAALAAVRRLRRT